MHPWIYDYVRHLWVNTDTAEEVTVEDWDNKRCKVIMQLKQERDTLAEQLQQAQAGMTHFKGLYEETLIRLATKKEIEGGEDVRD